MRHDGKQYAQTHTPHDLQEELDIELIETAIEELPDDVKHEHTRDQLKVIQLRQEHNQIRRLFPSSRYVFHKVLVGVILNLTTVLVVQCHDLLYEAGSCRMWSDDVIS
jgi:hypothetical protein